MSASPDLKSKEEKDAELDKRIEALRRKNQALIKRYQEIEEDRRKAEQEGVAVTGARRPRSAELPAQPERRRGETDAGALTVQLQLAPKERRVVSHERKQTLVTAKAPRGSQGALGAGPGRAHSGSRSLPADGPPEQPGWEWTRADLPGARKRGRGRRGRWPRGRGGPSEDVGPDRRSQEWEERRRQNIEKMNEEMERIAEYERGQRDGFQEKNPVRNFLDDPRRSGPFTESNRREGSRRHIRNWGGADFDKVRTGLEQGKDWSSQGWSSGRRRGATALDMTLSMTGRERAEYARWKQERDQIDQERLARHRQPTGEWRREWDAEKMDPVLKEGHVPGGPSGGRRDEAKRAPKQPTLGEFLLGQRADRHRKGQGCGHPRGSSSEPYGTQEQDSGREQEGLEQAPSAEAGEDRADAASVLQAESRKEEEEEEEEDQWEDVSEEEEAEGGSRQGSSSEEEEEEEEGPPPPAPPLPPWQQPAVPQAPPKEALPAEGIPPIPSGPAEEYQPVSDWAEEMELSSPRADARKRPTAVPLGRSSAGADETDPPFWLAKQGSLPLAQRAAAVSPRAPDVAGTKSPLDVPAPEEELAKPGGNGEQPAT